MENWQRLKKQNRIMSKPDLDIKIEEIKQLVTTPDYDTIDKGVALARELNEPAVFEALLKDCRYEIGHFVKIDESSSRHQPLIGNKMFPWIREPGTKNTNPYLEFALLNLIGYAHEGSQLDESIQKNNMTKLFIWGTSFSQFPLGILELGNLRELHFSSESENKTILPIPDEIGKLSQLESLSWSCNIHDLPI